MNLIFLKELAAFLAAKGFGVVSTSIFIESMPSTPEDMIGLYISGGSVAGSKTADTLRIQVLVRGNTLSATLVRAQAIWDVLSESAGDLPTKARITADGQPGTKFRDSNELVVFSLDFTAFVPR